MQFDLWPNPFRTSENRAVRPFNLGVPRFDNHRPAVYEFEAEQNKISWKTQYPIIILLYFGVRVLVFFFSHSRPVNNKHNVINARESKHIVILLPSSPADVAELRYICAGYLRIHLPIGNKTRVI